MKITLEFLKIKNACNEGLDWVTKNNLIDLEEIEFLRALIKNDQINWASWLIIRVMNYGQYVAYAIYAAEQVIEIYEKKYPDDKRPRNAIEAAKKCLENLSIENKTAAAYDAAYAAAYDTDAIASAAYAAAYDAAAAANADATAAAAAANAAANDAANDAANAATAAAANAAAYAAAYAATAAAAAANDAANAAANDTAAAANATNAMKVKILEYGISLLGKK